MLCWTQLISENSKGKIYNVLVQPDVGSTKRVVRHRIFSIRAAIRTPPSENVTNPRTWHDLQSATTHPDLRQKQKYLFFKFRWTLVDWWLTLKEISRFSPPQTFIPASYSPISKKYSRSMAKRPPAMVGDLKIEKKCVLNLPYLYWN